MRFAGTVSPRPGRAAGAPGARWAASLLVVAACGLAAVPAGAAQTAAAGADAKAGEALFASSCSACHADGGNLIEPKKPLRGSAKLKDFTTFLGWIREPETPMPPFPPEQISDDQARELFRYVTEVLAAPKRK